MINPNIFKSRNDWNVKAMMCKRYNYIIDGELYDILKIVAKKNNIPVADLLVDTNKREIVEARQIYFKRAKETTKKTLASIGKLVGRDHSTVCHGIKTVNDIKYLTERYNIYFNGKLSDIKPALSISDLISCKKSSPYAGVMSCNDREYHGYPEHSL